MKNEMTAFVTFALNYNHNFVTEAFGNNLHLQAKWNTLGPEFTGENLSYGRMVKFWSLLSDDNRDTLAAYIKTKYIKPEPTTEEQARAEVIELARMRSLLPSYSGCSVHVCLNGKGQPYIDDMYDPSCIATFVNGEKQ